MIKGITANLMVKNVEETIKFYEGLSFATVASVPAEAGGLQFAILNRDGFNLMIQEKNNFIAEYPALAAEKFQASISLYIEVDDLAAWYAVLEAKLPIYTALHETFYGAKEFAILDNNGYVLTFTER